MDKVPPTGMLLEKVPDPPDFHDTKKYCTSTGRQERCFTVELLRFHIMKHNPHLFASANQKGICSSKKSEPPETLLAEFLDTCLGARAAGGRRGRHGLGQSRCRHIILSLQGLNNTLKTSLLLSEIMLHTREERKIAVKAEGDRDEGWAAGAQFRGGDSVKSSQIYLYSSFFTKRDKM